MGCGCGAPRTHRSIEAPGGCRLGAVGGHLAADTPQLRHVDLGRMGITSLGRAFLYESGIERVDLTGLQLTSLDDDAFRGCAHLTSLEAPGGCSLGAVGRDFAVETPQLRHVDADNIRATSIGDGFLRLSGILEEADRRQLQSTMTRTHHDEEAAIGQ